MPTSHAVSPLCVIQLYAYLQNCQALDKSICNFYFCTYRTRPVSFCLYRKKGRPHIKADLLHYLLSAC